MITQKKYETILALGMSMVEKADNFVYGWTVALSPTTKVCYDIEEKVKTKVAQSIKWGLLTPKQQIQYFMNVYYKYVVQDYVTSSLCVFEFTKKGEIHMHILCVYYNPKNYSSAIFLEEARKGSRQDIIRKRPIRVTRTFVNNPKCAINMNYIHDLKRPKEWVEYLAKDQKGSPYPCLYRGDISLHDIYKRVTEDDAGKSK